MTGTRGLCDVETFDRAGLAWWRCGCGAASRTGWSSDRRAVNAARSHVLRMRKKRRQA